MMLDDAAAALLKTRLAEFAAAQSCPVYRVGDFSADPGKNSKALYFNVTLEEQHGDRAILPCEIMLRTAVSGDSSRSVLDALSTAWAGAAETVFAGFGVVQGDTSYSVDDNFHLKTINYKLYKIGGIQ